MSFRRYIPKQHSVNLEHDMENSTTGCVPPWLLEAQNSWVTEFFHHSCLCTALQLIEVPRSPNHILIACRGELINNRRSIELKMNDSISFVNKETSNRTNQR